MTIIQVSHCKYQLACHRVSILYYTKDTSVTSALWPTLRLQQLTCPSEQLYEYQVSHIIQRFLNYNDYVFRIQSNTTVLYSSMIQSTSWSHIKGEKNATLLERLVVSIGIVSCVKRTGHVNYTAKNVLSEYCNSEVPCAFFLYIWY